MSEKQTEIASVCPWDAAPSRGVQLLTRSKQELTPSGSGRAEWVVGQDNFVRSCSNGGSSLGLKDNTMLGEEIL